VIARFVNIGGIVSQLGVTISDIEWGYILFKVVKYFKNNLYFLYCDVFF
jgi:hypothetical protein